MPHKFHLFLINLMVAINKKEKLQIFFEFLLACKMYLTFCWKDWKDQKKKRIDEKSKEDEQKPHWKQIRDFFIAVGNSYNCFYIWPSLHPGLYFLKYKFHKVVQLVSIGLFWFRFMPFSYTGVYFLWQTFSSAQSVVLNSNTLFLDI